MENVIPYTNGRVSDVDANAVTTDHRCTSSVMRWSNRLPEFFINTNIFFSFFSFDIFDYVLVLEHDNVAKR